ncbi:MAG TPA: hypothetical protein VJJ82_02005 [Candidatus Nanoarchaeia archaeon]|nr:hypothetical protein [Candidatus Nanoarchaeia archaeon]
MNVEAVAGLIKRAYPDFSMSTFENRLKIQKFFFLMRHWVDIGYRYGLYIRGPYSPDLARDAFQVQNWESANLAELDKPELEKNFKEFLNFYEPHKTDIVWLECASTIAMISELLATKEKTKVLAKVHELKPHIASPNIEKTFDELLKGGYL